MEPGLAQDILNWVSAHPGWSGVLIFLISFVESVVLIGLLVPGSLILFGIGALVGLGALDFWPVWVGGSLGAFLGDYFSFQVGRRYHEQLRDMWPFSRYPAWLERGTTFFERHGAKSIFAGRFIGPLRPVIPASAGILDMPQARFLWVSIPACILWTPAYVLPGMLFGASLEVAAEYAGRLTLVLALLVAVVWLTLWAIGAVYSLSAAYSGRWLARGIRWSRRHPVAGRITGPIIDPSQPEVLSVSMLGLLLVLLLWGFAFLLFLSPFASQPESIDLAVQSLAQSMRNHIADPFMVAVTQLSRWTVLLPTAAAVWLWLLGARRNIAAAHWLVAIAGGLVLQALTAWSLRATPVIAAASNETLYVPSAPITLTTVIIGFFTVMVARELRRRGRKWPYLLASFVLALLLVARIYLGLDWLSGALVGSVLGLAWTAILGIAYRQRARRPFSGAVVMAIFTGVLTITMIWQINQNLDEDLAALQLPLPTRNLPAAGWWQHAWQALPVERTSSRLVKARTFNIQAAVPSEKLRQLLESDGWVMSAPADWSWLVQALNPQPTEASLPLIGKGFLGHRDILILRRTGEDPAQQDVLRLWDSGTRLQPGDLPVFLGQYSTESLARRMRLFSYWRADEAGEGDLQALADGLTGLDVRMPRPGLLLIRQPARPGWSESPQPVAEGDPGGP